MDACPGSAECAGRRQRDPGGHTFGGAALLGPGPQRQAGDFTAQNAFKVLENNAEQPVKLFRREDIPISLGIVIDNSGSMREKRQRVEAAAIKLVKASNPQDEVFIVNYNDDAYLDVPFTNQLSKLEEGVARIDARGGTAMRDAISMSIDHLKQDAKKDKKVILVITDGNDTASTGVTLEKLVEKAHKSEVLISALASSARKLPGPQEGPARRRRPDQSLWRRQLLPRRPRRGGVSGRTGRP